MVSRLSYSLPREFKQVVGVPTIPLTTGIQTSGGCPYYSQPRAREFKESGKAPRDSFAIEHLITVCQPFHSLRLLLEVYQIVVKVPQR
jgi:hypothetical protein